MDIYNFMNQKYREWKKTGKSVMKFLIFDKKNREIKNRKS